MSGRLALLTAVRDLPRDLELAQLGVFEKYIHCGGRRNKITGKTFQEPHFQEIGAKETKRRVQKIIAPAPAAALVFLLGGHNRRIAVDAPPVVGHIAIRIVMQWMAQPPHGSVDENLFVRVLAAPA